MREQRNRWNRPYWNQLRAQWYSRKSNFVRLRGDEDRREMGMSRHLIPSCQST